MHKQLDDQISPSWKISMKKDTDFMSLNTQFYRIVNVIMKQKNSLKDLKCVKMNR